MVEIKEVTEGYDSIAKLLYKTVENLETIGNPIWIIVDGEKYLVSYACDVFSIVNEDSDIVATLTSEGEFKAYVEDFIEYYYKIDETGVIASKTDKNTNCREQVYYFTPTKKEPMQVLHYYQENPNGTRLLFDYLLADRENNYINFLTYINHRVPDAIRFFYRKNLIGNIGFNWFKDFLLNEDIAGNYSPCIISIDGIFRIVSSRKLVRRDELLASFKEVGYNREINTTLANIITGSDPKVRMISSATKAYREYRNIN